MEDSSASFISRSRPNSLKVYSSNDSTLRKTSTKEEPARKYSPGSRHENCSRYDRALSQETNPYTRLRKTSIYCEDPPELSRENSVARQSSRASSILPDLETAAEEDIDQSEACDDQERKLSTNQKADETVTKLPVRNRTSHGVGQYDLERAATWALIGSNKPDDQPSEPPQKTLPQTIPAQPQPSPKTGINEP